MLTEAGKTEMKKSDIINIKGKNRENDEEKAKDIE